MTILNFGYMDPAASCDRASQLVDFTKANTWNPIFATSGHNTTEDFNFKRWENSATDRLVRNNGNLREIVERILGACDLVGKPTNTEYWVRLGLRSSGATINNNSGDFDQVVFYNYNGTRYKKVASLVLGGTTWKYYVHTTTEGVDTVVTTLNLGTPSFGIDAIGNMYIDVRVKLDVAAGFIQLYGTTGTMLVEQLGATANTLPVTHIQASISLHNTYDAQSTFTIIADEPTIGMFVAPIYAKAEGGLQQQDAGGAYTSFQYRLKNPGSLGTVSLTAATGIKKQYSMKTKTMEDIALPANYVVKSVKLSGIFEAQSAKFDPLPVNMLLRDSVSTITYEPPVGNVIPNYIGTTNKNYQRFHHKMDTNPITGAAWQVSDFTTLELGFSFTGN